MSHVLIDDELHQKLKVQAAIENTQIKLLLNRIVTDYLNATQKKRKDYFEK